VEESLRELEKAGVKISYVDKEPFRQAVESMYTDLKVQQPEIYKIVEEIRAVK
jgi:TRAP-type C4-dicarboxylate transport system substrate-binding protein